MVQEDIMEQENISLKTIYVAIPSLSDRELSRTIANAFEAAEFPERVHLGVAIQDVSKREHKELLKRYRKDPNVQVSFTKLNSSKLIDQLGVGLGRAKSHGFYNEQDYVLQVDSHTMFMDKWDSALIQMLEQAKLASQNEKTILTAYAGSYFLDGDGNRTLESDHYGSEYRGFLYPLFSRFERRFGVIPTWETVPFSKITDSKPEFVPAPKFNANFAFGDSEFAKSLGLEAHVIFFEEEVLQSVNLLGAGWSLAFPVLEDAPIKHLYASTDKNFNTGRKTATDYLSKPQSEMFDNIQKLNYLNFLADENKSTVKGAYERYANVSLELGRQNPDTMHPLAWRLDIHDSAEDSAEQAGSSDCGCKTKHDHAETPVQQKLEEPADKPKEARPWDLLNPSIGRVSEEIKEMRMEACRNCEFFVKLTQQCTKCGCIMPAKTGLPHASCPVGKWDAVPDDQEK